jgi:hypothetical protein
LANGPVSLPRSSNRTCGFPASGFPTDFMAGPRRRLLRLRPAIELPLKAADIFRRCKAHRQSPSIPDLLRRACLKSGAFAPSALPGIDATMPLSDSRSGRHPLDGFEGRSLALAGLPRLPAPPFPRAVSNTPADREEACRSLPRSRGLPRFPGGSASTLALSRPARTSLTLRPIGSLDRPRRPLSRGSGPESYPSKPLVSYQSYRLLSGWNLPPLVVRAFGAHWKSLALEPHFFGKGGQKLGGHGALPLPFSSCDPLSRPPRFGSTCLRASDRRRR